MKENRKKGTLLIGWLFLLSAGGIFVLQASFLLLHGRLQFEYIDTRLFYIFNIAWSFFLVAAFFILLHLSKRMRLAVLLLMLLFIAVNGLLIQQNNQKMKQFISISPDYKHVFSIKDNKKTGEKMFYRSSYQILGRPVEEVPYRSAKHLKIKWLANDIAAITYRAEDRTLQEYIATYGDRSNGVSYYYVVAQIRGIFRGEKATVGSDSEGISVRVNGKTESFDWDHIVQFGTLAIVLMREEEAIWTIALNEDFEVDSNSSEKTRGTISLYKTTLENNEPIILFPLEET